MIHKIASTIYKVSLETITDICISANYDNVLESKDYVIHDNYLYILNFQLLDELIIAEKLTTTEIENIGELLEKRKDLAERYLKDNKLKLANKYGNKLSVNRFWRYKIIEGNKVVEKYAIPASTIKGVLKSGFLYYFLNNVEYTYTRDKKGHLNLKELDANITTSLYSNNYHAKNYNEFYKNLNNTNIFKNQFSIYEAKQKNDNIEFEKKADISEVLNSSDKVFFKNIICSDLILKNGDPIIKKVDRISRKNNKYGPSQYYELIQTGSNFIGNIKFLNHMPHDSISKKLWLTLISIFYNDFKQSEIGLVDICIEGLRKYSKLLIETEMKYFSEKLIKLNQKSNFNFYSKLLDMHKKGDIIIKIGKSGIMAKSFMVFDSKNIKLKDNFAPYTINIDDCNKAPIGWVRLKIEELKDK
ncbi:hypothetical protein ACAG39_10310 [Caldicellulosiruptoraceae bacterium PP1]